MQLNIHDLREIARNFGHTEPTVRQTRRGWVGTCGCGFRSVRTPDQATAEDLLTEHIVRTLRALQARQRASGKLAV